MTVGMEDKFIRNDILVLKSFRHIFPQNTFLSPAAFHLAIMALTHRQILDVVIIAYYVVAFPFSIRLIIKHGFSRSTGWFYLVLLSLLRLIGAGTGYASVDHPNSQSLLEASVICTSIGISPLLLTLLGILNRVNCGIKITSGLGVSKNYSRIIHIPVIGGLILAIVAGTKQFNSSPSTRTTGEHLLEGGVILFIAGFAMLIMMAVMLFSKRQYIIQGENKLLTAGFFSHPFIFVRILYSVISAFDHNSTTFDIESDTNKGIVVQAVMSVLMEFIAVAVFIIVGMVSSRAPRDGEMNASAAPAYYDGSVGVKTEQEYGRNGEA